MYQLWAAGYGVERCVSTPVLLWLQSPPLLLPASRQTHPPGVGQQVVHPRRSPCHSSSSEEQVPCPTSPLLSPRSLGPSCRGPSQVLLSSRGRKGTVCLRSILSLRGVVNPETDATLQGALCPPRTPKVGDRLCKLSLLVPEDTQTPPTHQLSHDKVSSLTFQ